MCNRNVIILRGLPGAGKSTWIAENLVGQNPLVCSADHYFMVDGKYQFDAGKLGTAHKTCMDKFQEAVQITNHPLVVVDNCNLTARDMKFYVDLAIKHGYGLQIVSLKTPADVAMARGLHGVPEKAYERLVERYSKPLPPEWQQYEVDP